MSHEKVRKTFMKCCDDNNVQADLSSIFDDILAFIKGILEMCSANEVKKLAKENPRLFEARAVRHFVEQGHERADAKRLARASRETVLKTSAPVLASLADQ